ncbi:E3 ubiquitin-protein ligase RNF128a isoform X2 [Osmerus eperlanus]|uniref:E3 ubiquitin-protein ligase RNF128a isoform X2 n=1 Tax=Osmerus eperlanus TaxID=29151 RepID=UPI002E11A0A4
MNPHRRFLPALLCLAAAQHAAESMSFWTTTITIFYWDSSANRTVLQSCSDCGLFGLQSPVTSVMGKLTVPEFHPQACDPHTSFNRTSRPWIALIERGNCTFSEKIRAASAEGASGVVIYNLPGTGDEMTPMVHHGTGDMVSIMIGHIRGLDIVNLVKKGYPVTMTIEVGKQHGPWMSHYSVFFVSISFFVVTAATVGYFIFYSARRLNSVRQQNNKQKHLKAEAKKAIGQLQVRTLKQGDEETGPDADTCAVCIDAYKPGDVLSILTCNHLFHKSCIEPWLLEHRTCPMCKCDILKTLGVAHPDDDESSRQTSVPPDFQSFPSVPEDAQSDTASSGYASVQGGEDHSSPPQRTPIFEVIPGQPDPGSVHIEIQPQYDNLAFEGDLQNQRAPRI